MPWAVRLGLDFTVFGALVTTALAWGWQVTAASLLLAFFGLLRPAKSPP